MTAGRLTEPTPQKAAEREAQSRHVLLLENKMKRFPFEWIIVVVVVVLAIATCCNACETGYPLIEAPTEVVATSCLYAAPVLAVERFEVRHVVRRVVVRQRRPVTLHRTIYWQRPALIPRLRGVCDVY